jgi:hypothetical protein
MAADDNRLWERLGQKGLPAVNINKPALSGSGGRTVLKDLLAELVEATVLSICAVYLIGTINDERCCLQRKLC